MLSGSASGCNPAVSSPWEDPFVRERILEHLGGDTLENASAVFVTAEDESPGILLEPRRMESLVDCLRDSLDVGRSLWDRSSLLLHLDIEYVNFDYPAEPYLSPGHALAAQRPVLRAIQEILLEHRIDPLHIMTGRGHHLVFGVGRESSACDRLARIGRISRTVSDRYLAPQPPYGEIVGERTGRAYAGAGMVLEHVAHLALDRVASRSPIAVLLTAVRTGSGGRGREMVSIDLSEYGDPLHTRCAHIPFTPTLKLRQQRRVVGEDAVARTPVLVPLPVHEMTELQVSRAMRNPRAIADLAHRASARIPDFSEETEGLVEAYERSRLARFHEWFYEIEPEPVERWPMTYDLAPIDRLPRCMQRIVADPRELLLQPAGILHVVRGLLTVGWHPRHIAGFIASRYHRDPRWNDVWRKYDPDLRADFYTRIFSGLFAVGRDDLMDFNCTSTQEKGYCASTECNFNLESYRSSLLARRQDERLGDRPLDGILLPDESL